MALSQGEEDPDPGYGEEIPDTKKRFKIPFSDREIKRLKNSITQMKEMINQNFIYRNHNDKNRCILCNMNGKCNYRLK